MFRFGFRSHTPFKSTKNYYIFRHGQTLANKERRNYGKEIFTAEILAEAVGPLTKLAEFLKDVGPSANFASPLLRVQQTIEIISQVSGKKFETDPRLTEFTMETGESFRSFTKRVREFVGFAEKLEEENILICTHGADISALINVILGKRISLMIRYPEPGVLVIIKDGIVEYRDFN